MSWIIIGNCFILWTLLIILEEIYWKFDIDIQRTKLIYENRLDNIINKDKQLSELTNFFMN